MEIIWCFGSLFTLLRSDYACSCHIEMVDCWYILRVGVSGYVDKWSVVLVVIGVS